MCCLIRPAIAPSCDPSDERTSVTVPRTERLARYGTPAYHYDLAEIRRSAHELQRALPDYAGVFYSLKANPHPDVVAELRRAGCRAEVCSTGELTAALTARHEPSTILYGGPGKTPGEIADALDRGVRHFSVESLPDLEPVSYTHLTLPTKSLV